MPVLKCTCEHEYQDEVYGKGNRLHNLTAGNNPKLRCTVCLNEKSADGSAVSKKKGKK